MWEGCGWAYASSAGHAFSKLHCLAISWVQFICEYKMGRIGKGQEKYSWYHFCSWLENLVIKDFQSTLLALLTLAKPSHLCEEKGSTSAKVYIYRGSYDSLQNGTLSKYSWRTIARWYPGAFPKELQFQMVFSRPVFCHWGDL